MFAHGCGFPSGSGRVSIAGMVCCQPEQRSHLFCRVLIHRGRKGERRSFSEADYAALLTAAHQQLRAPLIVCWDNFNSHISARMRDFIAAHADWLTVVRLPAYAPDLKPAEGVWANLKNGLGNLAVYGVNELAALVKTGSNESSTNPPSSTDSSPRPDSCWSPSPHEQTPAFQPL